MILKMVPSWETCHFLNLTPQELILNFNILELNDPFKVTNALLMLLEDTMDELHVIKPFNDTNSTIKEIL